VRKPDTRPTVRDGTSRSADEPVRCRIAPGRRTRYRRKGAEFYRDALGFQLLHFHDYVANHPVPRWDREEPAIYAEMAAGDQRFGLHLPQSDVDRRRVGGLRIYFRVRDLDGHRRRVMAHGIDASEVVETAWMKWFSVHDADSNEIVFGSTDRSIHTHRSVVTQNVRRAWREGGRRRELDRGGWLRS